jgi:hypothetical protein
MLHAEAMLHDHPTSNPLGDGWDPGHGSKSNDPTKSAEYPD